MALHFSCLGQFQVLTDGAPVRFATDHGRALLTYLAVEADRPHTRTYLAFLLWPDHAEPQALNNLRQTLIRLRQSLSMGDDFDSILHVTPKTMQFHSEAANLDVANFRQLLAQCKTHNHRSLQQCPACIQRLEQAAALYKGDFLQGLSLRHSQPFNEWATYIREELHHQMTSLLHTLATHYEEVRDFDRARSILARQLTLEPWQEEAHCQMMRVLAKSGQRAAAILQYETCRRVLQEELNIAPSTETTLLYEQIKADTFERADASKGIRLANGEAAFPSSREGATSLSSSRNSYATSFVGYPLPSSNIGMLQPRWGDLPITNRLYGRQTELAQLETWLVHDHSQLIVVLGMGGIGKTAITASAVEVAAQHYDFVLWRSLLNAPTLDEILRDWLSIMAADSLDELPELLKDQLTLLLHHLRQRRCLLILDNVESLFHADQAGQVRPEYADYTQLFQYVAEAQHRSCLVLTSREQLQGIALLEDELPWIHTLRLQGLDSSAAQMLLMARGLGVEQEHAGALVARYSGNPLALKLSAETIQEVFNGNVESFLSADALIFDDIRVVLEKQFSRLPRLEQEILMWLAIEREPLSLEKLRENLAPKEPTPEIVQALRSLQRRSLLQRTSQSPVSETLQASTPLSRDTRFASPNVIMEYLVNRLVQTIGREIDRGELYWLHSLALMQAQAQEYVRQSQIRLILQPIANQVEARLGRSGVGRKIMQLLDSLHSEAYPPRTYAVGNLLNLLVLLEIDISGLDLSGLAIWQADLRHTNLAGINLAGADLTHSCFADAFGFVHTVAVSPDGTLIAAGTTEGEIRLWSAATGQLLHVYRGHRGPVCCLAFRPDGKALVSGGEDHRVRLWYIEELSFPHNTVDNLINNPGNGAVQNSDFSVEDVLQSRILEGHGGRVHSVAFHPGGTMLASSSADQTIRLWDIVSGETRAILYEHEKPVWGLAISPDGRTLASGDSTGMICLWDTHTAELRTKLHGHTFIVMSLAFDPGGEWLISGSYDRMVRVWDAASGENLHTLEGATDTITSVAISPDGALMAVGGDDRAIRVWETQGWSLIKQLHGHSDTVRGIAFGSDRQTLVSAGIDHVVCVWDLEAARIRRRFSGYSHHITSLAFHPSGKLLASGHYDHRVRLWDIEQVKHCYTLHGHTLAVTSVAFDQEGTLLASGSDDKSIQVWTIPSAGQEGDIRRRFHLHGHQRDVTGLAFRPDGKMLYSSSEDLTIGFWDLENGLPRNFVVGDDEPFWGIKLNPTGTVIVTNSDRHIKLRDAQSGELIKELPPHATFTWSSTFSPDGKLLATGGSDGSISLWNVEDVAQATFNALMHGHSDRVFALAFSPDGSLLATGGADQTVRLWDVQGQKLLRTMQGHSHWVWTIVFSPDGKTLVSGGIDETIRLWDIASGNIVAVLETFGPYAGMEISGVTGISDAERSILKQLGAVEELPL